MAKQVFGLFDERVRPTVINDKPSKTQQHFRDECNINTIMAKARKTGFLPVTGRQAQFMDCVTSSVPFHEMHNKVAAAKESFAALPAYIRKFFDNNPINLISFLSDENNRDQAIELGLIPAKEVKNDVDYQSGKVDTAATAVVGANSGDGAKPSENQAAK